MAPRTRPRTDCPRHEVLEQHPQVLRLESNRRGATQTQSATVQSNLNRNTRERATEDITSTQDDPIDVETETVGNKRKRVRGPTCMPKVWGQQPDELVAVSFNDLGQPNDEFKTCTLSHFLGTIARNGRYCPLHYKDWRLMPRSYKDEMLKIVKKISEKNKQTRAKLELLHRMGKKSFAIVKEIMKKRLGRYPTRAELFEECYYRPDGSLTSEMIRESIEQMKEVSEQEQEPECSNDNDCIPNLNDAYAKIMGQDKHGYLRMYGMGVTPADVCGAIPGRDASYRLAMEYKSKYMEAVEKFDALNAKVESLSALVNGRAQSVGQIDVQNIPLSS